MSIFDKVKDVAGKVGSVAKGMTDVVTGKGAELTLVTKGALAGGGTIHVTMSVKSTGGAIKAEGAFIDLYGEDDPDENALEKAKEFVMREKGPKHALRVSDAFVINAGETQIFEADVKLPAELSKDFTWMVRGRIDTFGNDPDTGWSKYEG